MKLPKISELPEDESKGELARRVYPSANYDVSLPQPWLNFSAEVLEKKISELAITLSCSPYDLLRTQVVWLYPPAGQPGYLWGYPAPLTQEADALLKLLDELEAKNGH